MRTGEIIWRGSKAFAICSCGKLVQLNKGIFGSLHFCGNTYSTPAEREIAEMRKRNGL